MVSIKARLKRLEKLNGQSPLYPYVVEQAENDSLEDAVTRTLAGRPHSAGWTFLLVPVCLTEDEWQTKYSPKF